MKMVTQNNWRPFDISVSTKLNKVVLRANNTNSEKQYKKAKDIFILPKIRKMRNKNNELNSPLEKYAKKNNFNVSRHVRLLSSGIFSCSIYLTFSNSKLSFILVMTQMRKEIKTIKQKMKDIIRIML